jgi:hypothetical protein
LSAFTPVTVVVAVALRTATAATSPPVVAGWFDPPVTDVAVLPV